MTTQLTTFIARWYNRFADWDGVYGSQCFDLIQFWSAELQGGWIPGLLAKDIMDQNLPNYDKVWNSPDNIPQEGDIVVWGGGINGGLGHTAIATGKGDVWTFQTFSQNDPVGSRCIYRTYAYSYVRGWLRRKVTTPNADEYVSRLSQALVSAENTITSGGGDGGNGGVGRIHLDYYSSYSGSTTPTIDVVQDLNLRSQVYTSMI